MLFCSVLTTSPVCSVQLPFLNETMVDVSIIQEYSLIFYSNEVVLCRHLLSLYNLSAADREESPVLCIYCENSPPEHILFLGSHVTRQQERIHNFSYKVTCTGSTVFLLTMGPISLIDLSLANYHQVLDLSPNTDLRVSEIGPCTQ